MKLLPGQMQALKAQRQASFLRRVADYAQAMTGQLPDRKTQSQLFDRGCTCGLLSEQQLAGFMVLGWIAWARQSGTEPGWVTEVLTDPHRVADDKLEELFARAKSMAVPLS